MNREFAWLRMPLAKMQRASKFSKEDRSTAKPGMLLGNGVSWIVKGTTTISRIELSDALL